MISICITWKLWKNRQRFIPEAEKIKSKIHIHSGAAATEEKCFVKNVLKYYFN